MAALALPLAIAGSVGGTIMQAAGHGMAAKEQAASAEFERQQLLIKQQQIQTAAAQDEARRRDSLTSAMETSMALRSERGVGSASPTGMALFNTAVSNSETDINTSRTNSAQGADLAGRQSIMAGRKAKSSLLAGDFAVGADIFGGVSKVSSLYLPSSGKS